MLNPPKISQKPPKESRALAIEQKRSPTKIEDLANEAMRKHEEAQALIEEKVETKATIENEKDSKVEIKKQDSPVVPVSNAVWILSENLAVKNVGVHKRRLL